MTSYPAPGVYGWSPGIGGVHFHRIAEPLRVAKAAGINVRAGGRLDDEVCSTHDTILVHMLWDEANSVAWEQLAAGGHHRLVFDIDDVMWDPDFLPFAQHYTPTVMARVWRNIQLAHVVTTPSEVIAEQVSRYNPNTLYVPNTVPEYLTRLSMPARERPTVGYQGSSSHDTDFDHHFLSGLDGFLNDNPEWRFALWGKRPHELAQWPTRVDYVAPWQRSLRAYYRSLEQGVTGYLVEPGRSWLLPLRFIADDPVWRASMGQEARRRAAAWTTEANVGRWVDAWNSI